MHWREFGLCHHVNVVGDQLDRFLRRQMLDFGHNAPRHAIKARIGPNVWLARANQRFDHAARLFFEHEPLCAGATGQECARSRFFVTGGDFASTVCTVHVRAQIARRVSIDHSVDVARCLLYTSPSPRDLSTSRMPSSA